MIAFQAGWSEIRCYALFNFKDSKDERAEKLEETINSYPGFDSVIDRIEKMELDF